MIQVRNSDIPNKRKSIREEISDKIKTSYKIEIFILNDPTDKLVQNININGVYCVSLWTTFIFVKTLICKIIGGLKNRVFQQYM